MSGAPRALCPAGRPAPEPVPERLLIWGGGGHGAVVADAARCAGHAVVGFVDADPGKLGRVAEPGGARVVCSEDELLQAIAGGGPLPQGCTAVALGIGDNRRREQAAVRLGARLAPPVVHPAAVVSPSASIGAGTVVFARAVLNPAASLGRAVIVNTGAIVEHDCVVADGAHLSPGAVLAGGVRVGTRSWVGAGATVIQGIRIGAGSIVGAGAVVIRDVEDGVTVVGVPARVIR